MNLFQKKPESENHTNNPDETDMTKFIRIFRLNSSIQLENNVLSLVWYGFTAWTLCLFACRWDN